LKRGKAGLIYVDGNMGPDNTHSREGTVIVNFCGRKISVKTGIVRLSQAFKYPIIPILTSQTKQQGKANHLVEMGDPILPRKITGQTKAEYQYETMQSLYLALEKRVKKDPTQWEYALCLHRWLTQTPSESTNSQSETKVLPPIDELLGVDEHIVINPKTTAKIQKGDKCVLVDVREGRGYIPPIWMPDLFDDLSQEDGTSLRAIKSKSADEESYQKTLSVLDQLRSIDLLTIKQVST
jgi:hypothetical protein